MADEAKPGPTDVTSVPFQVYLDSQLAEVRRAVDLARISSTGEAVPLRQYVEAMIAAVQTWITAVLEEQRRGVMVAEQEREKAAQEQRRGQETAEQEREKAAVALRAELQRAITSGDANLKDHIQMQIQQMRDNLAQQIAQVQAALASASKLDEQRSESLTQRITDGDAAGQQRLEAVRRETAIIHEASQTAIAKAEDATERRFESVNEFRAQLGSQTASFLPREVAEAQFAEIRRAIGDIAEKVNRLV